MANTTAGVGGGTGSPISDHEPHPRSDETTPSRVYVNGIRIPCGDVTVYMRKEGTLAFTRYVEGEFGSPHNGVEYTDAFETLRPDEQSSPDTLRVDVQDDVTGEYYTAFHGTVTGVGSAGSGGSKWWQFRAEGPGHRFDEIPAAEPFQNAAISDVLTYVTETFVQHSPLSATTDDVESGDRTVQADSVGSDTFTVNVPFTDISAEAVNPIPAFRSVVDAGDTITPGNSIDGPLSTQKTFQYGKHTLADVVSWLSEKANLTLWMEPTPSGVELVATRQPNTIQHRAHYLDDGDTRVVNNDALSELRPVNTMVVKAPAKNSVDNSDTYNIGERGETVVAVKARHRTLYERAGGTELWAQPQRLSDAMSKSEVVNEATKRLKNAIDETTAGDMQSLLRGPATPFDTITAKPVCDDRVDASVPPLTYEASRITHHIKGRGLSETVWNVGLHTDPDEDIKIIDSWQPEGQDLRQ